jgi:hypothetical protein
VGPFRGVGLSSPADADSVSPALRLGWSLAELRGRNDPHAIEDSPTSLMGRKGHALPLGPERTSPEKEIAWERALEVLATNLHVNPEVSVAAGSQMLKSYSEQVKDMAIQLADHREHDRSDLVEQSWDKLAELLYRWDAEIQDALSAASQSQASAYQLGRGMAEIAWNLAPDQDSPNDPTSWDFLLGPARRAILSRFLGHLSGYFDPLTAPAIAGSLEAWSEVAQDAGWRSQPDAVPKLRDQIHRWYELLVLRQDPKSLVRPYALLKDYRVVFKTIRIYWQQVLTGALAIGALAALGTFICGECGVDRDQGDSGCRGRLGDHQRRPRDPIEERFTGSIGAAAARRVHRPSCSGNHDDAKLAEWRHPRNDLRPTNRSSGSLRHSQAFAHRASILMHYRVRASVFEKGTGLIGPPLLERETSLGTPKRGTEGGEGTRAPLQNANRPSPSTERGQYACRPVGVDR